MLHAEWEVYIMLSKTKEENLKVVERWRFFYTSQTDTEKVPNESKNIVNSIHYQWFTEVVDFDNFWKIQWVDRYILLVIRILTKYAWAIKLKPMEGKNVKTFQSIFASRRLKPLLNNFRQTIKKKWIVYCFSLLNNKRTLAVELFNRTLKTKMWKYVTHYCTLHYIDA